MARSHFCHDEWVEGPVGGCPAHRHIRNAPVSPLDYRHDKERRFSRDVHAYREAKRSGLQADQPSERSVEKAEQRAESQERATNLIGDFNG